MILVLAALALAQPPAPPAVTELPRPAPARWAEVAARPGQLVRLASDRPGRWVLVDDAGADLQPGPDGKAATFAASVPTPQMGWAEKTEVRLTNLEDACGF